MKIDVLCIGTPKIIGDAVGPMVGTRLEKLKRTFVRDVQIIGTVDNPVVRSNYEERIKEIRKDAVVIVVDATVGPKVGEWAIEDGPMHPGSGLNNSVGPIGDMCVKCYTAATPRDLLKVPAADVERLVRAITTRLLVLINYSKLG